MAHHLTKYNSINEYLAAIDSMPVVNGVMGQTMSSHTIEIKGSWLDTPTWESAIEKAKTGDPDIATQIMPTSIDLIDRCRTELVWDVTGGELDSARDIACIPECYQSIVETASPVVSIMVNLSCHCGIKSQTIIERGKAILELLSGLESNGYSVAIDAHLSSRTQSRKGRETDTYTTIIRLKEPGEYFNLHSLAFWLVSPSVLRRFSFKERECLPHKIQAKFGANYGYAENLPDALQDTIYFPKLESNESSWKEQIKEAIEKYNIN